MTSIDPGIEWGLFAATLLLVPALAWYAGRAMGRRDWRVSRVIVAGTVLSAVPLAGRLAVETALASGAYIDTFPILAQRTLDNPEVGLFLVTLGIFMSMIAWTATPVRRRRLSAERPQPRRVQAT